MPDRTPTRRRNFLGLIAGAACAPWHSGRAENALAVVLQSAVPTIVVAGPPSSELGDWARTLRPVLDDALQADGRLRLNFIGGRDGVTGANQFNGRVVPGGQDALLFPGYAALAWLAGDSRVRFDTSDLIPVLASVSPGLLMVRGGRASLQPDRPMRVACAAAIEPALTALLGLFMLGVDAAPALTSDPLAAVNAGLADAVFLRGAGVPAQQHVYYAAGLMPAFTVGHLTRRGSRLRDPAFPDVPTLEELLASSRQAGSDLAEAWRAVAAASVLDMALAMPRLSTAADLAQWRKATTWTLANQAIADAAIYRDVSLLANADAAAVVASMHTQPAAQQAFRLWLSGRLKWRPG